MSTGIPNPNARGKGYIIKDHGEEGQFWYYWYRLKHMLRRGAKREVWKARDTFIREAIGQGFIVRECINPFRLYFQRELVAKNEYVLSDLWNGFDEGPEWRWIDFMGISKQDRFGVWNRDNPDVAPIAEIARRIFEPIGVRVITYQEKSGAGPPGGWCTNERRDS
jgi:hypothetical protein